ncbi:hypothetical protein EGT71_03365 [Atlantibacter subterranea]|uniref:Uncharacterized protein n=1 Tax=Atlantibacter subterraneus TaxID=255519 RepID=A0A427V6Q0_9ENTR|nr:hypothetical protein EGK67_01535 [Atlantibacter subterranea]RSE08636.1 hypothetical protein EGT84_01645 [Atlantibacter subterranea]RSE28437.1 hypothetical protein EGT71_03365 [Atlantibacter subterranea]
MRGFSLPIEIAEAFAGGRGWRHGCRQRVRATGCSIAPDPKPDAISRGDREAAISRGGAGVARGAAASPPGPFAYTGA